MGNPLLDISAVVDKDFLDKWVLCVTADGRSAVFTWCVPMIAVKPTRLSDHTSYPPALFVWLFITNWWIGCICAQVWLEAQWSDPGGGEAQSSVSAVIMQYCSVAYVIYSQQNLCEYSTTTGQKCGIIIKFGLIKKNPQACIYLIHFNALKMLKYYYNLI